MRLGRPGGIRGRPQAFPYTRDLPMIRPAVLSEAAIAQMLELSVPGSSEITLHFRAAFSTILVNVPCYSRTSVGTTGML
jgi:hypothetical protein